MQHRRCLSAVLNVCISQLRVSIGTAAHQYTRYVSTCARLLRRDDNLLEPQRDIFIHLQEIPIVFKEHFDHEFYERNKMKDAFDNLRDDQRFIEARHDILGPDLATAHFVVSRGGRVKFLNDERWFGQKSENETVLPNRFVPDLFIEAIDVSEMPLMYEGLENFVDLQHLRALNLRKCPYIDDWCLSKMHQFESLLYLDISACEKITDKGLSSLHHLRNLQTLIMTELPRVRYPELMTILLEETLPQCSITSGVDYTDPLRLEHFIDQSSYRQPIPTSSVDTQSLYCVPEKIGLDYDNTSLIAADDLINWRIEEGIGPETELIPESADSQTVKSSIDRIYAEMVSCQKLLALSNESNMNKETGRLRSRSNTLVGDGTNEKMSVDR